MTATPRHDDGSEVDLPVSWSASISMPTTSVAYVASTITAAQSVVLKTVDAGTTWDPVRSEAGERIAAVSFVDAMEGWGVGNGGTILHTSDGGATWAPQSSGTSEALTRVYFVDNQLGVALGNGATVARTADGGVTTWVASTLAGASSLEDVWFADASNGVIAGRTVGGGQIVFTTTDGGQSWTPLAYTGLPSNFRPTGVAMPTTSVVMLIGEAGAGNRAIYRSEDGGATWAFDVGTNPRLGADIVTFDAATGIVVGNGLIMRRQ